MTQPRYEAADALVYDPVASNRAATRAALRSLGFRSVEFATSLDEARTCLWKHSPDLLLCEVGGAEAETCALVQAIRQAKLGENPFIVTIITTWRRDGTIVNQAINSGADDLIARPFTAASLGERLRNLIERRKDFAVTSEYIGPDRRRDQSRAGAPCFAVPNTLRLKAALAGDAEAQIALALREGRRLVDTERTRRDIAQLSTHWQVVGRRQPGSRDFTFALARVAALAGEIERRAPETEFAAAAEYCAALREACAGLAHGKAENAGTEIERVLEEAGQSVGAILQLVAAAEDDAPKLLPLDGRYPRVRAAAVAQVAPA